MNRKQRAMYRLLISAANRITASDSVGKFLERISKGGKGSLNLAVLKAALPKIGWRVEDAVVPTPLKDNRAGRDLTKLLIADPLGISMKNNASGGPTVEAWSDGVVFRFKTPEQRDQAMQKFWEIATLVTKKPAPPCEMNKIFAARDPHDDNPPLHYNQYKIWIGCPGVSLTAPDGTQGSFAIPIGETPSDFSLVSIWSFLYKNGAKEAALSGLEGGTIKAPVKRGPGTTRNDNVGTCAVCSRVQVMKPKSHVNGLPGMVLHGYARPGIGFIMGRCSGIDWPPWELSPAGLQNFVDNVVAPSVASSKAGIESTKKFTRFRIIKRDGTRNFHLFDIREDGSLDQRSNSPISPKDYDDVPVFSYEDPTFDKVKESYVNAAESRHKKWVSLLEEAQKSLDGWKPGVLIQDRLADEKNRLATENPELQEIICPGSGRPMTTGVSPNGYAVKDLYSRGGALCSECGQFVKPASVRDFRGNGIARKHNKP